MRAIERQLVAIIAANEDAICLTRQLHLDGNETGGTWREWPESDDRERQETALRILVGPAEIEIVPFTGGRRPRSHDVPVERQDTGSSSTAKLGSAADNPKAVLQDHAIRDTVRVITIRPQQTLRLDGHRIHES